jgi:hypothetical protein
MVRRLPIRGAFSLDSSPARFSGAMLEETPWLRGPGKLGMGVPDTLILTASGYWDKKGIINSGAEERHGAEEKAGSREG